MCGERVLTGMDVVNNLCMQGGGGSWWLTGIVIRYLSFLKLRHVYEKRQGALAKCVDFSAAKVKGLREQDEGLNSNEARKKLKRELTTVSGHTYIIHLYGWIFMSCTIL